MGEGGSLLWVEYLQIYCLKMQHCMVIASDQWENINEVVKLIDKLFPKSSKNIWKYVRIQLQPQEKNIQVRKKKKIQYRSQQQITNHPQKSHVTAVQIQKSPLNNNDMPSYCKIQRNPRKNINRKNRGFLENRNDSKKTEQHNKNIWTPKTKT